MFFLKKETINSFMIKVPIMQKPVHWFALPRLPLLTIYKSFIRPHLDYGDIIYDQAYNVSFHQKLESIQYNSALAITGAIRGTSTEKLYNELGLENLEKRRWYRKLCCFYKVYKSHFPKYFFNITPVTVSRYNTRGTNNFRHCKLFSKFLFPFCGHWMEQTGPKYS